MKKTIVLLILVLCGANILFAQSVLSGYSGYWERSRRINIIDLIEFYPDQLPYLRNEIYARYGRPFVNQTYRDYFKARRWYQEKSNFSESWLSRIDTENAAFILSVEQSIRSIDAITAQVLKNIEYTGNGAILTFTSRQELQWSAPQVDFGPYGLSGYGNSIVPWTAVGDWILIYQFNFFRDVYDVVAYRLDHGTKRNLESLQGNVDTQILEKLLRAQGRIIPDSHW